MLVCSFRKVKEAWESNREVLVKSGAFAIEQLSEALSASAQSNKLSEGLPQTALNECANQVGSYSIEIGKINFIIKWNYRDMPT